jgi:hypothetical protein
MSGLLCVALPGRQFVDFERVDVGAARGLAEPEQLR